MFDLAWSEIAVIGVVAVLVLGPKELPQAMRTMAKMMRKMRSLTSELQGHMNEIVREAELDEVRTSIQKLSSTNIQAEITKHIDPTGEMQSALNAPGVEPGTAPAVSDGGLPPPGAPGLNEGGLPPLETPAVAAPLGSPEALPVEATPAAPLEAVAPKPDHPATST